jgi:hypothetical protein
LAKEGVFWGRHTLKSLQALVMLGYAMSHSQIETWALLGEFYIAILPEDRNGIAVFLSFSSAFGFKARRQLDKIHALI